MTTTTVGTGRDWRDVRARAQSGSPDLLRGPSHLLGDHSAGSYRRWVLSGGPERADADERDRRDLRRAMLHGLWRRVHGAESCPPDVRNLRNYDTGPSRVMRECWQAWHALADYVAALPPPGDAQTTTDAAGPRAGHLTTTGEGSALPIYRESTR